MLSLHKNNVFPTTFNRACWAPPSRAEHVSRKRRARAARCVASHPRPTVLTVPEPVANVLERRLRSIMSPYTDIEAHLATAQSQVAACLPQTALMAIKNFKNNPQADSVMLLRNLPLDAIKGPTPTRGEPIAAKTTYVSEAVMLGVAQLLGEPFGYQSEKRGQIVHNICPTQHKEDLLSHEGSKTHFGLHSEVAFAKYRPDFLCLLCVKADHNNVAATTFCDVRDALGLVGRKTEDQLRRHAYRVRAPASFEQSFGRVVWSEERPIISGPAYAPEILIRLPDVESADSAAADAVRCFSAALNHQLVCNSVFLQPGNLLLINNRKAVHGRSAFIPRYDGDDRWLHRTYVRSDLWEARNVYPSDTWRVLTMHD